MGTKFSDELRDFNPEDVPPYSFDSKNGYSKRLFRTMKSPRQITDTYTVHISYTYIKHTYQYLHIYIYVRIFHLGTDWRLFAAIPGEQRQQYRGRSEAFVG